MLESCLFESSPDRGRNDGRKKPAVLAMSTAVHVLIAGALILIPLLQTQAVPPVALPLPPLSPGPQVRVIKLVSAPSAGRAAAHPVSPVVSDAFTAPLAVPDKIAYVNDVIDLGALDALNLGQSTNSGGTIGATGVPGLLIAGVPPTAALPPLPSEPPTPPPAPKIQLREPIRVGSIPQGSMLIRKVEPVYPHLAVIAHVEGVVIAEARITQTGTIDNLRIISGNPLFTQSVIDAVKQWRYRPTLLNGEPVDVITTITVNFKLN